MGSTKNKATIRLIIPIISAIGLLLIVSCQSSLTQLLAPSQSAVTPESAPRPTITAAQMPNTAADTIASIPQPALITLTLWTTEQFSPQDDLIVQQLANFEQANHDIKVEVFLKRTSGQASALNFLRTAQPVAPSILPDVAILNIDDLPQAWRGKLIQPLDDLLDQTVVQDLLPAARTLGTIDDNLIGLPIEMDVEHLVYNTGKVFTAPLTWASVLTDVTSYQFPADGENGLLNDSLLIQYLSSGAKLVDDQGSPIIDEPALRALLNYYQGLRDQGIIDPKIIDAGYAKRLWDNYLAGLISMTHINARQYMSDRRLLANTQVAPIPSQHGDVVTIGHGWAFVLVTNDPLRQNAALRLIEAFMQSEANAAWARHSAAIPTRRASFDQIAGEDPYWAFLSNYLEATRAPPFFTGYDQLSRILFLAVKQVIGGEASPDEAIETAIQALGQSAS